MAKRRNGGIPASALGAGDPAAAAVKPTPMALARHRVARGESVVLHPYGEVWVQLLGAAKMEEIEAATFRHMAEIGLPPIDLHVGSYNLHRFRRIAAASIRDLNNHDEPFGTLD